GPPRTIPKICRVARRGCWRLITPAENARSIGIGLMQVRLLSPNRNLLTASTLLQPALTSRLFSNDIAESKHPKVAPTWQPKLLVRPLVTQTVSLRLALHECRESIQLAGSFRLFRRPSITAQSPSMIR